MNLIRNFCIIAHIDHGKSTLADRLLEMTQTIEKRKLKEQLLDSNPIERERGITIKLAPVRMKYEYRNPKKEIGNKSQSSNSNVQNNFEFSDSEYILNLIDTPGHVDFSYEVSRSLAACEGALLIVDATQGVQAQTIANLTLARKQGLVILPIINKIDLPNADIEKVQTQLKSLGFDTEDCILISAKTGKGVDQVLESIVEKMPSPKGNKNKPLRALVFSSQYDTHKGVVVLVRVVDGALSAKNDDIHFLASNTTVQPIEIGYFMPQFKSSDELRTGEVGYIATGLKDVHKAKVGDTVTAISGDSYKVKSTKSNMNESMVKSSLTTKTVEDKQSSMTKQADSRKLKSDFDRRIGAESSVQPLPGYQEPKPMVFLGLFPIDTSDYTQARDAMGKLHLSDSAFSYRPISSLALGNGFHCGFLGLLHAEVVQERLSREFGLSLLATAPSVEYKIKLKSVNESRYQGVRKSNLSDSGPDSAKASTDKQARMTNGLENKEFLLIQSATEYPDPSLIEEVLEPMMNVSIYVPEQYVGNVMQLAQSKRAEYIDLTYVGSEQNGDNSNKIAQFSYLMPLSEMIIDFFDQLKSATQGYASLDYKFFEYQSAQVSKLDVLINHERVDAFSQMVVSSRAQYVGRQMVDKLSEVIPRKQFLIPIQAAIGGKIIARADVKAYRKDVTQKLYGGDRTRKDKLLKKQKKGKKKMKQIGSVDLPQEAFLKVFSRG